MFNPRNLILSVALAVMAAVCVSVFALARSRDNSAATVENAKPRLSAVDVPATAKEKVKSAQSRAPSTQLFGAATMLRFTLYEDGIWPRVMHAPAGLVTIQVTDRSSHSGAILIRDERNKLAGNITPAGEYRRNGGRMILTPGVYQIIDNGKSKNSATLIVDAK